MQQIGQVYVEVSRAIEMADSAADPAWRRDFLTAIYATARTRPYFNISDVWRSFRALGFTSQTSNRMAAGAAMRQAAKTGWMRRSNVRAHIPNSANHNYNGLTVWNSNIYDADMTLERFRQAGQMELAV